MTEFLQEAKAASRVAATLDGGIKNRLLHQMADALEAGSAGIMEANAKDMEAGNAVGLASSLMDRLFLDEKRIGAMATALREIAGLKEPVGRVLEGWMTDNGLRIEKVSVPIGVIGMIYESRPNVTSDAAGLCLKSGNVAILKGGKEATHSNAAIAAILREVLVQNGLPEAIISLLPDGSREGVAKLIKEDRYLDLIIPRGGEGLIRYVNENATVPVVKHDKGVCHVYLDRDGDMEKAVAIAINAKVQRTGVCNTMETLLVDRPVAETLLLRLKGEYDKYGTELRGCEATRKVIDVAAATETDWETEYLENILSIRIVDGVEGAVDHIARYGSGHSDSIVTENYSSAERFLNAVDSAAVYVNASTRFTDGGVFGFGAEVGISTNKLHARGPMGINDLTTYKFKVYGSGQVRV